MNYCQKCGEPRDIRGCCNSCDFKRKKAKNMPEREKEDPLEQKYQEIIARRLDDDAN